MVNSQNGSAANYNKPAYFGMVVLGLSSALFMDDFALGACLIALSVIFYPFDATIKWSKKSATQKILVIGHLIVAIALIAYSLFIIVQLCMTH